MTTCVEAAHYRQCQEERRASPEMAEAAREHFATCFQCGGSPPSPADLVAIYGDMFLRVGHADICKDPKCKHADDPPSLFERQVVRQFKRKI